MTRPTILLGLVLAACTTNGSCGATIRDVCSAKADEVSAELAKIAAQHRDTPDAMRTAFVGACEGKLNADLDEVLTDLRAISDASVASTSKDSAP